MNDPETIQRILSETKTIAVVGLSSRSHRAGYYVPAYLQQQGYRIIPVNPNLDQALGEKAYPDLASVPEPVDTVLIFRRKRYVPEVVDQAITIRARHVWMQQGVKHAAAAEKARAAGLDVVMDACMMVEHRFWKAHRG
ncbi:MAG: CoA-binding protein [Chloroflexi bacterium]|nr:CoA-binding protein [Chloroflexota bacterium]